MSAYTFTEFVWLFFFYGFIGWLCEVLYCSVPAKKFINRGFLGGPWLPIYGFGGVAAAIVFTSMRLNIGTVFLISAFGASVLEYVTSWLLESIFNIRWWDYSKKKWNLNGRVCLQNSLLFGILGILIAYGIQPAADGLLWRMPVQIRRAGASALMLMLLADLIVTLNTLLHMEERLAEIQSVLEKLEEYSRQYKTVFKKDLAENVNRLISAAEQNKDNTVKEIAERLEHLLKKERSGNRQMWSFPGMRHKYLQNSLSAVSEVLKEKKIAKKDKKITGSAKRPERGVNRVKEAVSTYTADINFYQICWIFLIAGVLGYAAETIFCLITRGYIESRQGLIYGPFSQVYAFGAVIMIMLLKPLTKYRDGAVFIGAAIVGGAFEWLCSWLQEWAFGTVSWEYSEQAYSIGGGRTSLLYMFFWGIAGVILMKEIYPRVVRFINRIPLKQGRVFTWLFMGLFIIDAAVSSLAVMRWAERMEGIEPGNQMEQYLDQRYPDDFMQEVYPNMVKKGSLE